jgi:FG-GAP-like repeat
LADVDQDGRLDVVTGSDNCCDMEPGFFWFRRGRDERFTAMPKVKVELQGVERPIRSSFRARLVDWDGDGRLDVVADATFVQNAMRLGTEAWTPASPQIIAATPFAGGPEELWAQPCAIDWDRDGRPDLISSRFHAQAGGKPNVIDIAWRRNVSGSGPPVLGEEVLQVSIPASECDGVDAADWDRDGWPDLIVGFHRGEYDKARRTFEKCGVRVYTRRRAL